METCRSDIVVNQMQGHRSRVRERYTRSDIRVFSDYEILEMVLFNAIPRADTKPLAKQLLARFGSLLAILNAEAGELKSFSGLGDAVVFQFKLMKDLFSRIHVPINGEFNVMNDWKTVINYCQLDLAFKKKEYFKVLYLNNKGVLIGDEICNSGTIDRVAVYPREIAKKALEYSASAIIIVHNHPSCDPNPSGEDIVLTNNMISILRPLDIVIYDHIVISGHKYFSFKGSGLI